MKKIKYDEKGIAFVVLLIIIFFLSMMSICYLFMSQTELRKSYMQEQFISALATAEAGLERAIWYLVNDPTQSNVPTPSNPKVTIKEYLGGTETGKYYESEICLISQSESETSGLSQQPGFGWNILPPGANIPFPKGNAGAVTINGRIYVIGGYGVSVESQEHHGHDSYKDDINYWGYRSKGGYCKLLLCYDPVTKSWENLGECPYGFKNKPTPINFNNKMYLLGPEPDVIVYDPQNRSWENVADMRTIGINRVIHHSTVIMDEKIYILGGRYSTSQGQMYGLVIEFDPANNTFRRLNKLPDERYFGAAGVINGKIYYVGGVSMKGMLMGRDPVTGEVVTTQSKKLTRTVWRYDPMADNGNGTVTVAPHMPWLEDDPNTACPEHLAPWGGGDEVEGSSEYMKMKMHVRDPEYAGGNYGQIRTIGFKRRPGLADHRAIVVDDKLYVIGGNTGLLRTYFDGPGYETPDGEWRGTRLSTSSDPNVTIYSETTKEYTTQRDLFYDYKDGEIYGNYDSYRDWQGQVGSYHRWNKELYVFDGNSWERLEDAPTMNMMTTGGMQGVGIANHVLTAACGKFYMIGGIAHHFRNPNRQYLNEYVVEGDDTRHGRASIGYVNAMYTSMAEYNIRPPRSQSPQHVRYKIISTGREKLFLGDIHRKIEAIVEVTPMTGANGFDGAIICDSCITASGNVRTDSYNSEKGAYTSGINDGNQGNIFSNRMISVGGNVLIDGNAYCGVEEDINIIGNAKVTGSKGSLGEKILLPDITVPEEAIDLGPIELTGNEERILIQNTYTCSSLRISGSAKLIINGNVNIYCTGDIDITGQGSVNYNSRGDTTNFHIYCPGSVDNIKLTGNNSFFGTIYAPQSKIRITGTGNIYGQIVANEINFSGNVGIIYDEQLKNTRWWPVEGGRNARTIYWREDII